MSDGALMGALSKRIAELEKRVFDLEHVAKEQHEVISLMREVVGEYKDHKDPEENSWTARNWAFKKNRLYERALEVERTWREGFARDAQDRA